MNTYNEDIINEEKKTSRKLGRFADLLLNSGFWGLRVLHATFSDSLILLLL